jgi:hypothetical protein
MSNTYTVTALAAALVITAAGCSTTPPPAPQATSAAAPSTATPSPGAPPATTQDSTVIPVTISNGAVTPTNADAQAVVGRPIVLQVTSDTPDSIHVHSVPARTFELGAGADQRFEFTVDVPGQVDVELHELHRTIVTITVRPQ